MAKRTFLVAGATKGIGPAISKRLHTVHYAVRSERDGFTATTIIDSTRLSGNPLVTRIFPGIPNLSGIYT